MAYLLIILAWFRYYVQDFLHQSYLRTRSGCGKDNALAQDLPGRRERSYGKFLLGVLGGGILGYCVLLATALGKQKKLCRGIQKRSWENE